MIGDSLCQEKRSSVFQGKEGMEPTSPASKTD